MCKTWIDKWLQKCYEQIHTKPNDTFILWDNTFSKIESFLVSEKDIDKKLVETLFTGLAALQIYMPTERQDEVCLKIEQLAKKINAANNAAVKRVAASKRAREASNFPFPWKGWDYYLYCK